MITDMKHSVISLVLGGGRGTRLYPLTDHRSKPAVPIAGKYRLVDIPISNCLNSGLNRILVLTQFNSASLNTHIKNTYQFDYFSRGFVDILAAEQNAESDQWYQGTADAVRQSMKHLQKYDYDYILILSGDQLYQMDFCEMIDYHVNNNSDITIATIPVDKDAATGFGILKASDEGRITDFIEKPSLNQLADWKSEVCPQSKAQGKEFLASMGIYIFSKNALKDIFLGHSGDDFGKEIIPHALEDYKVLSYQFEGYWTDIGTIASFFEANLAMTADIPDFNMFSTKPIYTRSRMLPPTKINGSYMEKVIFGDGAIVMADRIENSIIGNRSRVGRGSIIRNTYMMGADYYQDLSEVEQQKSEGVPRFGIGENCYVENAILDKNSRVGDGARIIGGQHMPDADYDTYSVRSGIVVVKKNAVIPAGHIIQ